MTEQEITMDVIERYRKVGATTAYNGVLQNGFPQCFMKGVECFTPGAKLVGRAKTVRYLPFRPDVMKETNHEDDSPEYRAMGACGPGDVLVVDALGRKWAAIGGEMVLLHLKIVGAEGIVTDGGIRDMDAVLEYGYKVYAGGRTPAGRSPFIMSYEEQVVIQCGGITVRPGDLIVADDDGIVCVPQQLAIEVLEWSEEHDEVEKTVKSMILKDGVAPGKYYNAATFARLQGKETYKAV